MNPSPSVTPTTPDPDRAAESAALLRSGSPSDPSPPGSRAQVARGRVVKATLLVVVVIAGVLVARAAVGVVRPHLYAGTVLQAPSPAPTMAPLELASGEPIDLDAFEGDVVLVFFGYSHCPDVCPATLSTATLARASLPESVRDDVHLLMVSLDPERDSLAEVQRYVSAFDADFLAVGGAQADIDRVATQYGVYYVQGEGTVETGYTIDHTATLLGIDPDGHLRLVWAPDVSADALAADLVELAS